MRLTTFTNGKTQIFAEFSDGGGVTFNTYVERLAPSGEYLMEEEDRLKLEEIVQKAADNLTELLENVQGKIAREHEEEKNQQEEKEI